MHWTAHLSGGPRRVNHAAVPVGNYIFSFGGDIKGLELGGNIDVHSLNADTLRWKTLMYTAETFDSVPFQRYGHSVVAFGHRIYLWGGRNDFRSSNILHCFDTRTFTWSLPRMSGKIPRPSDGHTACVIGGYMYVFGGYEGETEMFKEGLIRINLTTFIWEEVQTQGIIPASRDFHTASVIGTKMYIFGGRSYDFGIETFDGGHYNNKICYLETKTMHWFWPEVKGIPPCGRRSHSAFVHKNQLFIICGYNSTQEKHFNDMYKFDPETSTWSEVMCLGAGPNPRRRQCCCVVHDRMYLFGGTSPTEESDCQTYSAENTYENLVDNSDLFVLDLVTTLYRLCVLEIIKSKVDCSALPECMRTEIRNMSTDNCINNNNCMVFTGQDFFLQAQLF